MTGRSQLPNGGANKARLSLMQTQPACVFFLGEAGGPVRKQGARGAGAADVGHTWGQGGRKMSKARPRDRYCRSRWGFRLTPDATCLPRHKGTPARGQVARQRAGVGHRHGACQDTCLGRGRGARMCLHAAREVPLARSQHGLGQLLTPFLPQTSQTSSGDRFLFHLPKRV